MCDALHEETYLVRESFQAVIRRDASSIAYITIMPGSLLTVLGDAEQSGTVRVSYMDRILLLPSCGTSVVSKCDGACWQIAASNLEYHYA